MLNKRFLSICLIIFAMAITGCTLPNGSSWPKKGVVSPKDAMPATEVVQSSELALSIESYNERYLIGEPVFITVLLENKSAEPQQVFGELRPSDGAMHILVVGPDGRQSTFLPLAIADYDSSVLIKLNSGEVIGSVFEVFFGARGWTFTEPGEYRLKAVYETPSSDGKLLQVESKSLAIFIERTSDGSGEFLIKDGKASYEAGKFLAWQAGDHLILGQDKLTALLKRWPESRLANYANFALGKSLSEPFMDYRKNAVRPANCERAMKHLSQVKKNLMVRNVLIMTAIAQIRCELRNKDWKGAREHLMQLHMLTKSRPEYKAIMERVMEYKEYLTRAVKE